VGSAVVAVYAALASCSSAVLTIPGNEPTVVEKFDVYKLNSIPVAKLFDTFSTDAAFVVVSWDPAIPVDAKIDAVSKVTVSLTVLAAVAITAIVVAISLSMERNPFSAKNQTL